MILNNFIQSIEEIKMEIVGFFISWTLYMKDNVLDPVAMGNRYPTFDKCLLSNLAIEEVLKHIKKEIIETIKKNNPYASTDENEYNLHIDVILPIPA